MGNRNAGLRAHLLRSRPRQPNHAPNPGDLLHLPSAPGSLDTDGIAAHRARQEAYEVSRRAWIKHLTTHPNPADRLPRTNTRPDE